MLRIDPLRWGAPHRSLDVETVLHFDTGEPVAEVGRALPAIIERDARRASRARAALRALPISELLSIAGNAAARYRDDELPIGDGAQSPDAFARAQSATTGLPESMCRANMAKNVFVLERLGEILDALTRGLDPAILSAGHGVEARGVPVSYQPQTDALGVVLPSNSPGVHTLWLPVLPLQIGLALKPGPQEPWTPYRVAEAFFAAGLPREAVSIYPGAGEAGAAVARAHPRAILFGSQATVDAYRGDPGVRVHGPGFSKVLIGEDVADDWESHLDLLVESVFANSGRSCINASGVWTPRHGREIAEALAERLAPVAPLPPDDPDAVLAAFTVKEVAGAVSADLDARLDEPGVEDVTARVRGGGEPRLESRERCAYLRPTVVHCDGPGRRAANLEYMFPFVSVVECPQEEMIASIGPTLVLTALTGDAAFRRDLLDATHVDRLNLGPVPTTRINWLQPHEGNLVDFLYRARAFQSA